MNALHNGICPAHPVVVDGVSHEGVTKQELMAAMVLQGILTNTKAMKDTTPWWNKIMQWFFPNITRQFMSANKDEAAKCAVEHANALLKELEDVNRGITRGN
jgi:hypothetical protein